VNGRDRLVERLKRPIDRRLIREVLDSEDEVDRIPL
jgi:hypothetical protein